MKTLLRLVGVFCWACWLAGCASVRVVDSDVSTYSQWPAERAAAGRYEFERLPSQQARGPAHDHLEALARPALESAGLRPVQAGQSADLLIQVGVRSSRGARAPSVDGMWWHGGVFASSSGRRGAVWGPSLSWQMDNPSYEHEVSVLIRDAASGQVLFEARASSEGTSLASDALQSALFRAALMDFPRRGVNPRRVRVPLAP